ncbi:anti-virulence regulator CigR family protein [Kosakonia pseudosacchari]|uniref:anti-virulence regulator CigR family protein n=1 Tax=Kosakonia pseudosacchari TaxID=1646340 RepID=UPI000A3AD839|nr:anti-virulence regulator CigR family protein [Kosakonia pseudosacchari]
MFKRRTLNTALVAVISLVVFSAPVLANPGNGNGNGNGNGGGHGNSNGNHGNSGNHANKGNSFSSDDRVNRKNYGKPDHVESDISVSRARSLAVNYGLTGYQSLPPGIAKNLARGKPLPPGIAKKAVPASMLGQLPYYPGYEWRIVGSDLVLVALSTAIVTAIINGVFD